MKIHPSPSPRTNGAPRAAQTSQDKPKQRRRLFWIAAALVLAAAIAVAFYARAKMSPSVNYFTSQIVRKDLVRLVTATGTVNPRDTIFVGTQVSGTVIEQDADFNTAVKKGQILTRLDPTSFRAQLALTSANAAQARNAWLASLAGANSARQNQLAAQANVAAASEALASAQAQVAKSEAALHVANLTTERDRQLLEQGFIAQAQADTDGANAVAAKSAYDAANIAVKQAEAQLSAQIASERAVTAQSQSAAASATAAQHAYESQQAAVAQATYNFNNTVIRSQVDGTVIGRNITIGQTVAASFQTPTLFTIGRDLTKMQVDVSVGEPDIGGVREGNIVDFTVLAYPNRTFRGVVYQVRRNPTTVNNVVTYDTVVYVENKDGALYPGMTANASIHVAKAANAIVVPVASLQYSPPEQARRRNASTAPRTSPWGITQASISRTIVAGRDGRLFVLRDGKPAYVPVNVLLVNDTEAAVTPQRGTLSVGDNVVTSDSTTQVAALQSAPTSSLTRQPSYGGGRPPGPH